MSPCAVPPEEEPLDLALVNADDALVETLRRSLSRSLGRSLSPDAAVVWDDDDEDLDPAFSLLRVLQRDVSTGLPVAAAAVTTAITVLPVGVIPLQPRRRGLRRKATVAAAIAAGVLSVGGVAAASAPGQPLAGMRHSISSAVANVVQAVTPDHRVSPAVTSAHPSHPAAPSARSSTSSATPPGQQVSAAARSDVAAKQVAAELDRAGALLDAGRYQPANGALGTAARRLPLVLDATVHSQLASRLSALQARLAGRPAATRGRATPAPGRPTSHPSTPSTSKSAASTHASPALHMAIRRSPAKISGPGKH